MTVETSLLMILIVSVLCGLIVLALRTEQGLIREAAMLEALEQTEASGGLMPQTLIRIGEALRVIFPPVD